MEAREDGIDLEVMMGEGHEPRRRRRRRTYRDPLSDIMERRQSPRPDRRRTHAYEDQSPPRQSHYSERDAGRERQGISNDLYKSHGYRYAVPDPPPSNTRRSSYAEGWRRTRERPRRRSLSVSSISSHGAAEMSRHRHDESQRARRHADSPERNRRSRRHRKDARDRGMTEGKSSSSDEDYERLTPGKSRIRTGHRTRGAHGTSFTVEVPSDIGAISSDSEARPPCASVETDDDQTMVGALPPGERPVPRPPSDERPLVTRRNSKLESSLLNLLIGPSHSRSRNKKTSDAEGRQTHRKHMTRSPKVDTNREEAESRSSTPITSPTPPPPEKKFECLTCCEEVPESAAAQLECGHTMCNGCLKRLFEMSVTDPQLMPPKCCTSKHIPLKFVAPLLENDFKVLWNQKFREFSTKDRMYCPKKGCGEWILPKDIKLDRSVGRRYGTCKSCSTKVCKSCNLKWHGSKDCKNDEETKQVIDLAAKEGWQRCYSCKAIVQLSEGCNHMRCRCNAEFCMICGAKWKTCDCPWFNTPPEDMPGFGVRFPPPPPPFGAIRPAIRIRAGRQPGLAEQLFMAERLRPLGYAAENAARRRQEREDEDLARRIAMDEVGAGMDPPPPPPPPVDDMFVRELNFSGRLGAHEAFTAALHLLTALGTDRVLQSDEETPERPANVRRNAAGAAWTRPRPVKDSHSRRSRRGKADSSSHHDRVLDGSGPQDRRHRSGNYLENRRREERSRPRLAGLDAYPRRSMAAMAGFAGGARSGDRVSGWLDGIAGGPNPFQRGTV